MVEGLLATKALPAGNISVTDQYTEGLADLRAKGVVVSSDNVMAVKNADVVIFAVKPWILPIVLEEVAAVTSEAQLFISVAAVGSIEMINGKLAGKGNMPIVRAIPNTAMAVRRSMTCICMNQAAEVHKNFLSELFGYLGTVEFLDESLLDAATAIASCGTAFALRFLRAMQVGGVEVGFKPDVACRMAIQTISGAMELVAQRGTHPENEIDKVTTPGGMTIAGLSEMEHCGFSSAVVQGVKASYRQARPK